ncbi:hypothetical protein BKA70DRAFT_49227 [Coprinopsis sp. MPI-PUGE-AT-0042]|nr:hypothetical protein BKA70DRAFT_49227 [Coprinopsis sp. MPI-PUGE-AT-0042]
MSKKSNAYAREIKHEDLRWRQPASSSVPPPMPPPVQPPPAKFQPKCRCPDPNCNVEELASKVGDLFADGNNTAIACLAQLKEIATLTAITPGVRQAAGSVLLVLETIGLMGDNVAHFKQLASQSLDHYLLLSTCREVINDESPVAGQAKEKLDEVATEFSKVMSHITETMLALNQRGKIRRYIFAKADKNDLDKHRSAMNHMIAKLQIVLSLANLAKKDGGGGGNQKVKQLTEQDVRNTAEGKLQRWRELESV